MSTKSDLQDLIIRQNKIRKVSRDVAVWEQATDDTHRNSVILYMFSDTATVFTFLRFVLADQVHPVMANHYVEMPNIPRWKTLSLPVMLPYWIIQDRTQD